MSDRALAVQLGLFGGSAIVTDLAAGTDRRNALLVHAMRPAGLTDFELGSLMHRQQTSAGKRRGELRDAGLIEETVLQRSAPSGAAATVWRITDRGKAVAREAGGSTSPRDNVDQGMGGASHRSTATRRK